MEKAISNLPMKILAQGFLLFPGINIGLALLGLLTLRRFYKIGIFALLLSILSLYLFSTPMVTSRFIYSLQMIPPLALTSLTSSPQHSQLKAIIVLGGGSRYAPEYRQYQPSYTSQERLMYAAKLHQLTQLPIIVLGGNGDHIKPSESELIKIRLDEQFGIKTQWIESASRSTWENILYAVPYLKAQGIESFYLVTSAFHMPRAVAVFNTFHLYPTPARTDYCEINGDLNKIANWLPSGYMLLISSIALHEYLAKLIYDTF